MLFFSSPLADWLRALSSGRSAFRTVDTMPPPGPARRLATMGGHICWKCYVGVQEVYAAFKQAIVIHHMEVCGIHAQEASGIQDASFQSLMAREVDFRGHLGSNVVLSGAHSHRWVEHLVRDE